MSFTEINLTLTLEANPIVSFKDTGSETSPIIPVIVPNK